MDLQIKDNLYRLWASPLTKNHDLAFQLFEGLQPKEEDYEWLWEFVFPRVEKEIPKENTRLGNFPNIDIVDVLQGRILDVLLQQACIGDRVVSTYVQSGRLRLPYTVSIQFPDVLQSVANELIELTWQDGELEQIDANIIAFQKLRRLDLRRQPITFIHPNIATLPDLEELYLVSTSFLPEELIDRQDIEIYTDAPY